MIYLKKDTLEWIFAIIIAFVIVALLNLFILTSYSVSGLSMYPTFDNNDKVIVSKLSKSLKHIKEGDVIVFHYNNKYDYIKRVIGKPGDIVKYKSDKLYINNREVAEPYLKYNKKHKLGEYLTENFNSKTIKGSKGKEKIPKHKYLVLGDNRGNSIDSRREEVGLVQDKQIVGKVILRYWPINNMQCHFNKS